MKLIVHIYPQGGNAEAACLFLPFEPKKGVPTAAHDHIEVPDSTPIGVHAVASEFAYSITFIRGSEIIGSVAAEGRTNDATFSVPVSTGYSARARLLRTL